MSMRLRRAARSALTFMSGTAFLAGCGAPAEPELSDPYGRTMTECLDTYEAGGLNDGVRAGDTHAIRCTLIIIDEDERPRDALMLRYFLYRIEGVEPRGLDALVRETDRRDLAVRLEIAHEYERFLEPFGQHWLTRCQAYDTIAADLLRRAQAPDDEACLP